MTSFHQRQSVLVYTNVRVASDEMRERRPRYPFHTSLECSTLRTGAMLLYKIVMNDSSSFFNEHLDWETINHVGPLTQRIRAERYTSGGGDWDTDNTVSVPFKQVNEAYERIEELLHLKESEQGEQRDSDFDNDRQGYRYTEESGDATTSRVREVKA
ncbi:hypothetical protein NEOLEDRAFT_622047 [Neolentinus lepideus HHB14362 ss-1]|uniref:Uncharacterized protein n=1 Tax=Neolentinus lepideus HHB14362 ss-1 TaxID=1314782 RepID=A0A165QT53_9AGAM|nr:hypothetical protein NEOLEDRAFT_622047 [Neolentinus lepideus HHB14362 ss-1]